MRQHITCAGTLIVVLAVALLIASAGTALTSTRGAAGQRPSYDHDNGTPASDGALLGRTQLTIQDPKWVAFKAAFRVQSGVTRGQAKGRLTHSYIGDAPTGNAAATGCVNSCTLPPYSAVVDSFEPGNGVPSCGTPCLSNFTQLSKDAADDGCTEGCSYTDGLFDNLGGPGAADVALYYWPWPPNLYNYPQGILEYSDPNNR